MIQAENIAYKTGNKNILHPMSFELRPGEITVLLGPNGAGKTTLLRILAGGLAPVQGSILLDHQPLQKLPAGMLAQKRAVLTQHYAVPLPFTCEEIVAMGRYPYAGVSTSAENRKIILQCMREMDVLHFAGRMFNTLSGGEQQRVQMARVLAQLGDTESNLEKILLLDEPTASMDCLHQQLVLSRLRKLALKGYTIIVVLHDLNLAAQYAGRILLLRQGVLLAAGHSSEVLQPSLVSKAYGLEMDIIRHEDYPFPILVPALSARQPIHHLNKNINDGTYTNDYCIEK